MSAIWGIINLKGDNISDSEIETLKMSFSQCKLDRIEEERGKNIYLGCGIQYFTKEAHYEVLPILDSEEDFFLDADVVLDNREELFQMLGILNKQEIIPDGTLLMMLLKKFGNSCLNKVLGAYSFVYKNKDNGSIDLIVDAVGTRCVYYSIIDEKLYFSSLIEPIALLRKEISVNERWMTDFIAIDSPIIYTEAEETPIIGIYRVAPGQIISITEAGIQKTSYWNPSKGLKELKYKTDEEYKMHFRNIFQEAVACVLRSDDETGILLSGGLDSTAIASIASSCLKEKGKKLYSFTSIPEKDYLAEASLTQTADESKAVEETKNILKNLELNFLDLPGVNPWQQRKKQMKIQEIPYKNLINSLWLYSGLELAYQKNVRIMLSGANGNSSISFGKLDYYFDILFATGHYVKLWNEMQCAQKMWQFSKKKVLKSILSKYLGKRRTSPKDIGKRTLIKLETLKKHKADLRLAKMLSKMDKAQRNYSCLRELVCDTKYLRQLGESEAKRSLYTGVMVRDPSRDKRIIEFCLQLPLEQFVKEGEERRLIRVYLADIMPSHVINNYKLGQQGPDLIYRMSKSWKETRSEWLEEYSKYKDSRLIDCQKAINELQARENIDDYKENELVRHMHSLMVLEYVDSKQR